MLWRCKEGLNGKCLEKCEAICGFEPKFCLADYSIKDWERDRLEAAAEKAKNTGNLSEFLKLRRELLCQK